MNIIESIFIFIVKKNTLCQKGKPMMWLMMDREYNHELSTLTEDQESQRRIGYLTALSDINSFIRATVRFNKTHEIKTTNLDQAYGHRPRA